MESVPLKSDERCKICELEKYVDLMLTSKRVSQQRYYEKIVTMKREKLSRLTHPSYFHACCTDHHVLGLRIRREYLQNLSETRIKKQEALDIAASQLLSQQLELGRLRILHGDASYEVKRLEYEVKRLKNLVAQRRRRLKEVAKR